MSEESTSPTRESVRGWTIVTVDAPRDAMARARSLIDADPIGYSVLATVTASLLERPGRYADPRWFFIERDGELQMAAMSTPPQPLWLPRQVPGGPEALAQFLVDTGYEVRGANGSRSAVLAFADHYARLTGHDMREVEGQGVFALPVAPQLPWPVAGEPVVAQQEHANLVAEWTRAFVAEIGGTHTDDVLARASGRIRVGLLSLWSHEDRPVAMCWVSESHAGVVRISGVYTPPAERGHGYASALVAAVSRQQQALGHRCMLYTQLSNPTSNKIYQALGYRRIGDEVQMKVDPDG